MAIDSQQRTKKQIEEDKTRTQRRFNDLKSALIKSSVQEKRNNEITKHFVRLLNVQK